MLARTLALVLEHLEVVLRALTNAGFVLAPEKTDNADTVSQVKLYLGFVLDSTQMTVSVSAEKLKDLRDAVRRITSSQGQHIKAKTLAKGIGKLVAAEPALGPITQLLSRAAQFELAQATEERGWGTKLVLSTQATDSLYEMQETLEQYNGYPIKNVATAKKLDHFIEASRETRGKEAPAQLLRLQDVTKKCRTIAGDASAVATCAMEVGDKEAKYFTQSALTEEEKRQSSGQRELLTILRALQQDEEFFESLRNQTVIWITDSTNLVSFLTKGTMKMNIQQQVVEVYKRLAKYKVRIVPVHLKRTDFRIQWADEGSREFDPDDWGIDNQSFRALTDKWKPTIDLFAHTGNTKHSRFYAYGNAPKAAGVDAFTQDWTNELAWICPPVYLVVDTVKKIANTVMMAVLIVPEWRTASVWNMLFPDGNNAIESCVAVKAFRPHLKRGKFCQNKLMQGRTAFRFLALYIRSKGRGYEFASGKVRRPRDEVEEQ